MKELHTAKATHIFPTKQQCIWSLRKIERVDNFVNYDY